MTNFYPQNTIFYPSNDFLQKIVQKMVGGKCRDTMDLKGSLRVLTRRVTLTCESGRGIDAARPVALHEKLVAPEVGVTVHDH